MLPDKETIRPGRVRISVFVDENDVKALKHAALDMEMTLSDLVRFALNYAINDDYIDMPQR
jgi:antitoxin component of RelBE/YafQ-DinJ toxin-antitoxin module